MENRSASQSTEISEETPSLPDQIITEEILPRLPAKSLLKFRCVSKPWCSLIGSKRFIKAHLKHSIKSSWIAQQWIFIDFFGNEFNKCYLPSLFDNPITIPISHIADFGIENGDMLYHVGCCNGLVCMLVNRTTFILWNPATKKFKNLPDDLRNLIHCTCGELELYGFGFDELTDDYKVFGKMKKASPPYCVGMIYSLRSNSWKPIENINRVPPIIWEGLGMYVSGKLHWCDYKREIVSFDLNSHVFAHVELPSNAEGVLYNVSVIEGCLSAHFYHSNRDLDFWVMRKYGVNESWDKILTVPYYMDLHIPTPVAIAPNGEVLLIEHSTIVIYNPKCDVLRHPQLTSRNGLFVIYVRSLDIYVESLVSIAPDAQ